MKVKIIVIVFVMFSSICKSQITLEHSYPTNLGTINFAISGYKYYSQNMSNYSITFYNLNHSLWKTINLNIPLGYSFSGISNISETLFNLDAFVEVSYGYYKYIDTPPHFEKTYLVINENGTILLTIPNCANAYPNNTGANGWKFLAPIDSVNTNSLSYTNVYSLIGSMPIMVKENEINNLGALSNPYPNPSQSNTSIDYQLPIGTNNAEIVLYNLSGNEIKRFKVDNTFNTLELNNSDLSAGTYLYQLITPNMLTSVKKMVIIK